MLFRSFSYLADRVYDETEDNYDDIDQGLIPHLKFIAARRILIKRNEWQEKVLIGMKNWSPQKLMEFAQEFQKVKIEWYWECIKIAEQEHAFFKSKLDALLTK